VKPLYFHGLPDDSSLTIEERDGKVHVSARERAHEWGSHQTVVLDEEQVFIVMRWLKNHLEGE